MHLSNDLCVCMLWLGDAHRSAVCTVQCILPCCCFVLYRLFFIMQFIISIFAMVHCASARSQISAHIVLVLLYIVHFLLFNRRTGGYRQTDRQTQTHTHTHTCVHTCVHTLRTESDQKFKQLFNNNFVMHLKTHLAKNKQTNKQTTTSNTRSAHALSLSTDSVCDLVRFWDCSGVHDFRRCSACISVRLDVLTY